MAWWQGDAPRECVSSRWVALRSGIAHSADTIPQHPGSCEARKLSAEVAETFGLAPDGHASRDSAGAECLEVTLLQLPLLADKEQNSGYDGILLLCLFQLGAGDGRETAGL